MNMKSVEQFAANHPAAFPIIVTAVSIGIMAFGGAVVSLVELFG